MKRRINNNKNITTVDVMIYKLPESYFCKLTGLVLRTLQRIALFTVWGELTGLVLRTPQRIALFIVWVMTMGVIFQGILAALF